MMKIKWGDRIRQRLQGYSRMFDQGGPCQGGNI